MLGGFYVCVKLYEQLHMMSWSASKQSIIILSPANVHCKIYAIGSEKSSSVAKDGLPHSKHPQKARSQCYSTYIQLLIDFNLDEKVTRLKEI